MCSRHLEPAALSVPPEVRPQYVGPILGWERCRACKGYAGGKTECASCAAKPACDECLGFGDIAVMSSQTGVIVGGQKCHVCHGTGKR